MSGFWHSLRACMVTASITYSALAFGMGVLERLGGRECPEISVVVASVFALVFLAALDAEPRRRDRG